MNLSTLSHVLNRRVLIRARRDVVFRFFTDSERWAKWWGAGSTIDARPGGKVHVRHPNGIEAGGEVISVDPPRAIVFSFGYASGQPVPIGASRVTIELAEDPAGTRLELRHEFADEAAREAHVQGWRYQLSLFGNAVADAQFVDAAAKVDAWFGAWSEPDDARRTKTLDEIVSDEVRFRDRFSLVDGKSDLEPHLSAVHRFMPGMRLARAGDVRHCQGTVLADWVARGADGTEKGRGTNVFTLDADGRIADVVGLWG